MNPLILKIAASVLFGGGAAILLIAHWWKSREASQNLPNSNVNCGNFDGSSTNTCFICLGDFEDVKRNITSLPCKHKYHKKCISVILKETGCKKTCPACRAVIPDSFTSALLS